MELCKFIRVEKKFESIDQLMNKFQKISKQRSSGLRENDQKLNLKGWTPTSGSSSIFSLLSMVPVFGQIPPSFHRTEKPSFGRIASMLTN